MGTRGWPRYGGVLIGLLTALWVTQAAGAHVLVTPTTSAPGAAQLYTITVQGERPVPTTRVQVQIPPGVVVASFAAAPGWQRQISLNSVGAITAITWSGGIILPQEYTQFGVYARNPPRAGALTWPTIQTYQDGFPVAWTGSPTSLQPAPITTLGGVSPVGATVAAGGGGDGTITDLALAAALLSLGLSGICLALLILTLRRRIL